MECIYDNDMDKFSVVSDRFAKSVSDWNLLKSGVFGRARDK